MRRVYFEERLPFTEVRARPRVFPHLISVSVDLELPGDTGRACVRALYASQSNMAHDGSFMQLFARGGQLVGAVVDGAARTPLAGRFLTR